MTRVCVRTPSRLHFGLIAPGVAAGRRFGGAGLMIDDPGVTLTAEPAAEWSASGPSGVRERVLTHLQALAQGGPFRPTHVCIESAAPEHVGLGTGTQLALGVAYAVFLLHGMAVDDVSSLAHAIGRFPRSGVGMNGFLRGGFIVDGGKRAPDEIAMLERQVSFPAGWRIVLARPRTAVGISGASEAAAFANLPTDHAMDQKRSRLLRGAILPALEAGDFDHFGEALYQFNRLAGEAFASIQGGPYASVEVAELIAFLRKQGVRGVGQSSWGPTVFALASKQTEADGMAGDIERRFGLSKYAGTLGVTIASRRGVQVTSEEPA